MANRYLYIGGQALASANLWQYKDNGSSLALQTSVLISADVTAIAADYLGNCYVGVSTWVYKYDKNMALVTTWGVVSSEGKAAVSGQVYALAANTNGLVFVACGSAALCYGQCIAATGSIAWQGPAIVASSCIAGWDVAINPATGNPVFAGPTVRFFRELNALTGALVTTWSIATVGTGNNAAGVAFNTAFMFGFSYNTASQTDLVRVHDITSNVSIVTYSYASGANSYPQALAAASTYLYVAGDDWTATTESMVRVHTANSAIAMVTQLTDKVDNTGGCYDCSVDPVAPRLVFVGTPWVSSGSASKNIGKVAMNTSANISIIYSEALGTVALYAVRYSTYDIDAEATSKYPKDTKVHRYLVTTGGDTLYWGSQVSTMAELTTATGALDCTKALTIGEAFQKVFVANNSALKVFDPANTKAYTTAIGANIPPRGTLLAGGTSGTQFVVDFISSNSAANVYGRVITTTSLISGETMTDLTGALSVSFSIQAISTGPHFYNWTPYANDTTTYGSMPSKATLVARYRGRLVLAGNPGYPHQWYMSRVGNPFDFQYFAGDPLSAVAGANADAGVIGDVIKALIPQGDDYLIFGCAGSMWILTGDPAAGGSIDEFDATTGIYGAKSWCRDSEGTLYFYGFKGLYQADGGRSKPHNISLAAYPQLDDDWAPDVNFDRITLTYDPSSEGIIIAKSNLSAGTNQNLYYDIRGQSYWPEAYPTSGAIFCSTLFPSTAVASTPLLFGCFDSYVRQFQQSATDDELLTDSAITAYVGWVETLTPDDNDNMKLNWLVVATGGAISTDSQMDTTSVNMKLFVADDAETCMQKMVTAASAFASTSFEGTGRKNTYRNRVQTPYLGIELSTNSVSAYWVVNKIVADIAPSGGI